MQNQKQSTILITGGVSLLSRYLIQKLHPQYDVHVTTQAETLEKSLAEKVTKIHSVDITNANQITKVVAEIKPDVVIHLAAISNIDYCEQHPELARTVNVEGTQNVVAAIKNHTAHLIFLSTAMVFSGQYAPYAETAEPHPLHVYGKTKAEAEKIVQQASGPTTIIRSQTLLGWPPDGARLNDLPFYVEKLKTGEPLHLVKDRFFNPLTGNHAAAAINRIIQRKHTGIVHLGGAETVSRFELVSKIAEVFGLSGQAKLIPVNNDYFLNLAPRPIDTTLEASKMQNQLGIHPRSLSEELATLKEESSEK